MLDTSKEYPKGPRRPSLNAAFDFVISIVDEVRDALRQSGSPIYVSLKVVFRKTGPLPVKGLVIRTEKSNVVISMMLTSKYVSIDCYPIFFEDEDCAESLLKAIADEIELVVKAEQVHFPPPPVL